MYAEVPSPASLRSCFGLEFVKDDAKLEPFRGEVLSGRLNLGLGTWDLKPHLAWSEIKLESLA